MRALLPIFAVLFALAAASAVVKWRYAPAKIKGTAVPVLAGLPMEFHSGDVNVESFKGQAYVPEEIRKLEDSLGDQYLCNFSVFQSLLDHWALDQLLPPLPPCP